ncbi:hypothetical protein [Granulicella arctica]|uniref:Uncharacterized protein n=1 Tax=Granulicella arctica TaxID=940613 RepID=A0A7Y9PEP0_9BACT|nr:hypothetical protein [Granulicella arctica]NYF77796.1 hypothetical protein [Granulicella arctica]
MLPFYQAASQQSNLMPTADLQVVQSVPILRQQMLSAARQRRGSLLLNQQCWVWGRDVLHPEGNLLLEYGFERQRCPEKTSTSTQYTLHLPLLPQPTSPTGAHTARVVRLWGFGLFFSDHLTRLDQTEYSGIFLNRFEFVARSVQKLPAFCAARDMASLKRADELTLLPDALRWIAGYEDWVIRRFGTHYRDRCLATWNKRRISPDQVSPAWLRLAQEIEASHTRFCRSS